MRTFLSFALVAFIAFTTACSAQDKSKRASPPATVSETINSGATITIDYSQPSVKGRTIGENLEPMEGKVWRAGANEATVFQADKDVKIEGKSLPAGKYSFFVLDNGDNWTLIFNKEWKIWGTEYEKNKGQDVLKVTVPEHKAPSFTEKLTYTIDKDGKVTLLWGNKEIDFNVQ